MATEASSPSLISKKKTTAPVWQYFGFQQGTDDQPTNYDNPICKECLKKGITIVVSAKSGNTSNLYSHVKNHHIELYNRIKPRSGKNIVGTSSSTSSEAGRDQYTITKSFERSQMLKETSKEYKELTKAITFCLAKDMLPLHTVEKPGFIKMLKQFNSRYKLPSRSYFSCVAIPSLYHQERQRIEEKLCHISFFASTTDMWSSKAVNTDWELTSYVLQTHFMPEDHTGENIKENLKATLEEWQLQECNQVAITTDSGSNIKLACDLLGWKRLSCFGHNLNLSIGKGLDDSRIDRVVKKCGLVVSAFSRSWKRRRELILVQEQKGLQTRKLVAAVSTRWGSTAAMIERLLEVKDALLVVLAADRKTSHLVLTWQDTDVLESIMKVLSPLKVMTDVFSGEKHVTISAILPILTHICDEILSDKDGDSTMTKEIKNRVRLDLQSRYDSPDISDFLHKCTFFDPRFKITKSAHKASLKETIEKELCDLPCDSQSGDRSEHTCDESEEPPRKKSGIASILEKAQTSSCGHNNMDGEADQIQAQRATIELESYLQLPLISSKTSPIMWWKNEGSRFPLLSTLARKYLCVPATSVASERVFSTGGNIVCDTRTCLKPEKVNMLIFLAKNL